MLQSTTEGTRKLLLFLYIFVSWTYGQNDRQTNRTNFTGLAQARPNKSIDAVTHILSLILCLCMDFISDQNTGFSKALIQKNTHIDSLLYIDIHYKIIIGL